MENKNREKIIKRIESENFEIEQNEGGIILQRWFDKTIKRRSGKPTVVEREIDRIAIKNSALDEIEKQLGKQYSAEQLFEHVKDSKKHIAIKHKLEFSKDEVISDKHAAISFKVNGTRLRSADLYSTNNIETLTNRMFGTDKVKNWQLEEIIQNIKDLENMALGNNLLV